MNFQFRIKNYNYEEGEYSEYEFCDKEAILRIIEENWTDKRPNGLHVISIMNMSGESLLLEHFGKDVFEVYFLPVEEGFHFHKLSKQELIYQCLDFFMDNDITGLESSLNWTETDDDFIRREFFYIDHNYRLTPKRELGELLWLIWAGSFGIMLIAMAAVMAVKGSDGLQWLSIFIAGLGIFYWLPGVLLHLQYRKDAEGLAVLITKGNSKITITHQGAKKVFDKADMLSVTIFRNPALKNPWSDYGYTEIKFKSGEVVNLSNLMVEPLYMPLKFEGYSVSISTVNTMIPRIRNKSTLSQAY